jgi:hypothetical protein
LCVDLSLQVASVRFQKCLAVLQADGRGLSCVRMNSSVSRTACCARLSPESQRSFRSLTKFGFIAGRPHWLGTL